MLQPRRSSLRSARVGAACLAAGATAPTTTASGESPATEESAPPDAGREICVHLRGTGFDGSVECTVRLPGAAEFREKVRANLMTDYGAVVCAPADARRLGTVQCGAARVEVALEPKESPCVTITRDRARGTLTSTPGCNGYD